MIRRDRILVWTLCALVGLLVLGKAVRPLVLPLPLDRCGTRDFDRASWHDSSRIGGREAIRGCMVDHLLSTHDFLGWSADSVVAVLGPPTATDYFRGAGLVYWLGPERGFMSIDSEWLVLTVDSAGRVVSANVRTD